MKAPKRKAAKKYFNVAEANATLPLVKAIVRDITELSLGLRERHERLQRLAPPGGGRLSEAHQEEMALLEDDFDRADERMRELVRELNALGVELKDYDTGLVDFPAWKDGHEVYLCWRLGEPEVAHWHEVDAGFTGRQKLKAEVHSN